MDVLRHQISPGIRSQTLIVFLPGRADDPEDLIEAGFLEVLRKSKVEADLFIPDAHFGYYISQTLIERLDQDVFIPARRAGYQTIWLAGISMGGLGALLYAQKSEQQLEGLLLVAPFVGDDELIEEIEGAGGISAWNPPAKIPKEDYQRALWAWLKGYADARRTDLPPIHLGWGDQDKFAQANELLASVLPTERVYRVRGAHQWQPWREILQAFLRSGMGG